MASRQPSSSNCWLVLYFASYSFSYIRDAVLRMERVVGLEPTGLTWQARTLTIKRYPHIKNCNISDPLCWYVANQEIHCYLLSLVIFGITFRHELAPHKRWSVYSNPTPGWLLHCPSTWHGFSVSIPTAAI